MDVRHPCQKTQCPLSWAFAKCFSGCVKDFRLWDTKAALAAESGLRRQGQPHGGPGLAKGQGVACPSGSLLLDVWGYALNLEHWPKKGALNKTQSWAWSYPKQNRASTIQMSEHAMSSMEPKHPLGTMELSMAQGGLGRLSLATKGAHRKSNCLPLFHS